VVEAGGGLWQIADHALPRCGAGLAAAFGSSSPMAAVRGEPTLTCSRATTVACDASGLDGLTPDARRASRFVHRTGFARAGGNLCNPGYVSLEPDTA
jgi:hypothetical protein